jgi:RNA polymerase sigma factor (sigma-70 family)
VAEDLAHEAFLKAIEKSETYHHLGSFDGWLMRINLNTTLDYLRRQPEFLSIEDDGYIASNASDPVVVETQNFASLQTDTNETHISASDLTESEILDAICALPDKQRTVFNLYVFDNQSHAKIAEALKIGVRSSKRYLSEARTQLQNTLNNLVQHKEKSLMILLPFLPWKSHAIDRLCRAKLKQLTLSTTAPSPLSAVNWTAAPKPGVWMAVTAVKAPAVATGVVATAAVTGSVVAWQAQPVPTQPTPQESMVTTCVTTDSDSTNINSDTAGVETQNFASPATDTIAGVETCHGASLQDEPISVVETHGRASLQEPQNPQQQVKGTESSVSPLPATSQTPASISRHDGRDVTSWRLQKYERNGYYGLKDEHENVIVSPKYSVIQPFDEYRTGWAMVEMFGFKGFVDSAGKEIVHPQYDEIGKFGYYRDGCALVRKGNFYGFIDLSGKEVVPVTHKKGELIN